MTIRFAAAYGGTSPAIVRALCLSAPISGVNDNQLPLAEARTACQAAGERRPVVCTTSDHAPLSPFHKEPLLADALRHFAKHGLSAAANARGKAKQARASGDLQGHERWMAISRTLDPRAAELQAQDT